jgi:hypothetical protein
VSDDRPEAVSRFPLQWPLGWTRTTAGRRTNGQFKDHRDRIGIPRAITRLQTELDRLGAADLTLSTNLKPRLDGGVVANQGEPSDPGVAIYFRFKGRATVFACDHYYRVADNLAAIAAHVDALRRIERYGVGSLEQALAGYRSLPADTSADWRQVFGFTATEPVTEDQLTTKYRERAHIAHPDRGGTDEMMAHVNRARDFALQEIR